MRALAWLWVKLLAPFTGAAELLASGDLMAGFCGPFCAASCAWAARPVMARVARAAARERIVSAPGRLPLKNRRRDNWFQARLLLLRGNANRWNFGAAGPAISSCGAHNRPGCNRHRRCTA